jgi:hypothetical protein
MPAGYSQPAIPLMPNGNTSRISGRRNLRRGLQGAGNVVNPVRFQGGGTGHAITAFGYAGDAEFKVS